MRPLLLGFIAAGVAVAVYAIFFRSSDEDRIHDRLDRLAAAVRIEGDALNPRPRADRIRNEFAEIFTEDARAEADELDETIDGRGAIVAAATQLAVAYSSANVSFRGVTMHIRGNLAEVNATAELTSSTHGQNINREERRVTFRLRKIDGDWKIVSAVAAPRKGVETSSP